MRPSIRLAVEADLPAINAIYNHFVVHSTCTYQTEPSTPAERQAWFDTRRATWDAMAPSAAAAGGAGAAGGGLERWKPRYPVTVAEEAGEVVGWGALNPFHPRAAYRFTTENSVYVHHAHHRKGIGRAILADLCARADALGFRSIIALISADQAASIALHRQFGFQDGGYLRAVGFKFDRWLDVAFLQRPAPSPA